MYEKRKSVVDKGKSFGALLTDLSKTFDCLSQELLLAKRHDYGFSIAALRLIHSYLTNRWQRTKINMSYSSWEEILFRQAFRSSEAEGVSACPPSPNLPKFSVDVPFFADAPFKCGVFERSNQKCT